MIVQVWLLSIQALRKAEERPVADDLPTDPNQYPGTTLRRTLSMFALNAVVTVAAAAYLPVLGEGIAQLTGLGQTFVRNIFVAIFLG